MICKRDGIGQGGGCGDGEGGRLTVVSLGGLIWEYVLNHFGSLWDRFGIALGSFWDNFGIVLGSFFDIFGIVLG